MLNPVPCFCCGKTLNHATGVAGLNGFLSNHPADGVGVGIPDNNYGSTVWDDCVGGHLEIAICDTCLKEGWDRTREVQRRQFTETVVVREGGPYEEDE